MTELPAITLWQPWATLVAIGAKPFEFRHWPAPGRLVGKRIAIHAGARKMKRDELLLLRQQMDDQTQAAGGWTTGLKTELAGPLVEGILAGTIDLPYSCIVCTAILGKPIRDQELAAAMGVTHVNDSDRDEHSNFGWPLSEIEQLLPPEPAVGRQGWWTWRTER